MEIGGLPRVLRWEKSTDLRALPKIRFRPRFRQEEAMVGLEPCSGKNWAWAAMISEPRSSGSQACPLEFASLRRIHIPARTGGIEEGGFYGRSPMRGVGRFLFCRGVSGVCVARG